MNVISHILHLRSFTSNSESLKKKTQTLLVWTRYTKSQWRVVPVTTQNWSASSIVNPVEMIWLGLKDTFTFNYKPPIYSCILFVLRRGEIERLSVWGVKAMWFYSAWLILLYLKQIVRTCCCWAGGELQPRVWLRTASRQGCHSERSREERGSAWSHCPLLDTTILLVSCRHCTHPHVPSSHSRVGTRLLFSWNVQNKRSRPRSGAWNTKLRMQYFNIDKARNTEKKIMYLSKVFLIMMYYIHPITSRCPLSRRTVRLLYIAKALRREVISDKCHRNVSTTQHQ